jgi:glycosyltransferase involved in cell wall biosynthesis
MKSPAVSLICTTQGREAELLRLATSLAGQTFANFHLVLVRQNTVEDTRTKLEQILGDRVQVLPSQRVGLSRARNLGLTFARGEIVAFPDDDCWNPPTLLEDVLTRLAHSWAGGGLTCRSCDADGRESNARWMRCSMPVTRHNVLHTAIEYTMFVPTAAAQETGFDEEMGVGAATPWQSAEGADFLVRLINLGVRMVYEPRLHVFHTDPKGLPVSTLCRRYRSYGRGAGYFFRKHRMPVRGVVFVLRAAVSYTHLTLPTKA